MEEELITLDSLTGICGYFNSQTPVNNGYGCNHKDCEEHDLVKIKQDSRDGSFYQDTINKDNHLFIRNKIQNKICQKLEILKELNNNDKIYNRFFKKLMNNPFSDEFIKTLGLKLQGACFSWSCPLAYEADEEDFERFGEDPERMTVGYWMVIDKEEHNRLSNSL